MAAKAIELDEPSARRLCLLATCESGTPDAALWSPEDSAWASRLADQTAGGSASDATWLAERARHAQERILPRRRALARAYARRLWSARWLGLATAAGLLMGALADLLGSGQSINLVAAPLWTVVLWNLLVYAGILLMPLRGRAPVRPAGHAGPLRRAVQAWLGGRLRSAAEMQVAGTPEQRFAALWAQVAAPLSASRAAVLLHVAALALALGLISGMYARALVLDYRASWQSTLLEPPQVHAWLSASLAPASALTGLPVPGVEAVAALRVGPRGEPVDSAAPATHLTQAPTASRAATAPWLHLFAATLVCFVIVPRALLAMLAAWQAHRRGRHLAMPPLDTATLMLLRSRRRGGDSAAVVQILPHGFTPSPASALALRQLLALHFGAKVDLHFATATAYGDEDKEPAAPRAGAVCRIAWFELAATPEPEAQGRFIATLRSSSAVPLVALADEAGYARRLGRDSPRLPERRNAWLALADQAGIGLACVDLAAEASTHATTTAAADALQAAWRCVPQ